MSFHTILAKCRLRMLEAAESLEEVDVLEEKVDAADISIHTDATSIGILGSSVASNEEIDSMVAQIEADFVQHADQQQTSSFSNKPLNLDQLQNVDQPGTGDVEDDFVQHADLPQVAGFFNPCNLDQPQNVDQLGTDDVEDLLPFGADCPFARFDSDDIIHPQGSAWAGYTGVPGLAKHPKTILLRIGQGPHHVLKEQGESWLKEQYGILTVRVVPSKSLMFAQFICTELAQKALESANEIGYFAEFAHREMRCDKDSTSIDSPDRREAPIARDALSGVSERVLLREEKLTGAISRIFGTEGWIEPDEQIDNGRLVGGKIPFNTWDCLDEGGWTRNRRVEYELFQDSTRVFAANVKLLVNEGELRSMPIPSPCFTEGNEDDQTITRIAPITSPMMGMKGKGKGKRGKGPHGVLSQEAMRLKHKAKHEEQGRKIVGDCCFEGQLLQRQKTWGWVKPRFFDDLPIEVQTKSMEMTNSKSGDLFKQNVLFLHMSDVCEGVIIAPGDYIKFKVYVDNEGAGVYDVVRA